MSYKEVPKNLGLKTASYLELQKLLCNDEQTFAFSDPGLTHQQYTVTL